MITITSNCYTLIYKISTIINESIYDLKQKECGNSDIFPTACSNSRGPTLPNDCKSISSSN